MTVLPLVGRIADSGNLIFLAMLVAISAVMLCVNILNQKTPVRVNIIDLIVLLFCSYVPVVGRDSDGVPAMLTNEIMSTVLSLAPINYGMVRVLVFRRHLDLARKILASSPINPDTI